MGALLALGERMSSSIRSALIGASTLLLAACSVTATQSAAPGPGPADDGGPPVDTTADAGPDVDNGAPSTVYPAPHPALPQMTSAGGSVLKTPRIVPVYFAADPLATQIGTFLEALGPSDYWKATTSEYGVGKVTVGTAITVATAPSATVDDADVQVFLASMLDGTHAEWGTPDESTVYTIMYPAGTTITDASGTACKDFGAYHEEATVGGKPVVYAVIPRCASFVGFSGIDFVTTAISHEMVEAVTDPFYNSGSAYSSVDADHQAWNFSTGGESADMCSGSLDSYFTVSGLGAVQRTWSNVAAAAGMNPCVPAAEGKSYFNSSPVFTDSIDLGHGLAPTKGVVIPVGASKTIELDLFSDAATSGPWTVSAADVFTKSPELSYVFDRTSGTNGEKLHLTITRLKAGTAAGGTLFGITSTLGKTSTVWYGFASTK